MAKRSAGVLIYRLRNRAAEVLLVHPGGPFWAKKDEGAWSIPKGEIEADEDPLAVARRECVEELGDVAHDLIKPLTDDAFVPLGEIKQKAGKVVVAFALHGDLDAAAIASNTVDIEWPPRSGKRRSIPEVDRAGWFPLAQARVKLNAAQVVLLDRLEAFLT